jgi:hypothetical protein
MDRLGAGRLEKSGQHVAGLHGLQARELHRHLVGVLSEKGRVEGRLLELALLAKHLNLEFVCRGPRVVSVCASSV